MPIRDTYRNAVLNADPLAYWRLGETAGVAAADESGNGRDGVYVGSPSLGVASALGDGNKAAQLDGVNDKVTVASSALNLIGGPLSVSARVNLGAGSSDAGIAGTGITNGYQMNWHLGTNMYFYVGAGASNANYAFASAGWHHVVGTWDGTTKANGIKLYIDGVLVAQGTASVEVLSATGFTIGQQSTYFNGTLDEVAVFARVLNPEEIADHYASQALATNQMALLYARAGYGRAGATRSDYFRESLVATIGGVDHGANFWKGTTLIRKALNEQPDTATFRVFGMTPLAGQEVIISNGSISNRLFGGIITGRTQVPVKQVGGTPVYTIWDVTCGDWLWDLAGTRVLKEYPAQAAHLIALDLAATYAPGYSTARIKAGAPVIDGIAFDYATLPEAFTQLAARCDPTWHFNCDADKVLHFFDVEPTLAQPVPITTANLDYDLLSYDESLTLVRTRVIVEGGGGTTTAPVAVAATSIPVDECGWYTGTTVKCGKQVLTYTGRSASSGPGNLTGVPAAGAGSIQYAIRQGDPVNILVTVNDVPAQTALAAVMGGTGIREFVVRDGTIGVAAATARANAELTLFQASVKAGGYESRDKVIDCGRTATILLPGRGLSVTAPITDVDIWFEHPHRTKRRAKFNSAIRVDLTDVVRSIGQSQA